MSVRTTSLRGTAARREAAAGHGCDDGDRGDGSAGRRAAGYDDGRLPDTLMFEPVFPFTDHRSPITEHLGSGIDNIQST